MIDGELRERFARFALPELPRDAFVTAPPLSSARVAIVTTAGLRRSTGGWARGDQGFKLLEPPYDELAIKHASQNFDRTGFAVDLNVVFPIDRLVELEREGQIGSVAPRHVSFMGAQWDTLTTICVDSGPAVARELKADGVDVVLLTGLCPLCPRTVATLARVLEGCGLATVVLSSNIELTRRIGPPRALHCDFPLGRPLGVPNDPAFQRRVLAAAFDTLTSPGPVLAEFPERVAAQEDTPLTCTVPPYEDSEDSAAVAEVRALRSAFERQRARRGTTLVGRVLDADGLPGFVEELTRIGRGDLQPAEDDIGRLAQSGLDLRAYYEEAAVELADGVPGARQAEAWFFTKTATGAVFLSAVQQLLAGGMEESELFTLMPVSEYLQAV